MSNVYKKLNKLGSGTFGEAWLVKQKDTDRKYALKEIRVSGMSERDRLQSLVEVEALARCKHVNIVRYKKAFVDRGFLCIIMEYGDHGDLKRKIQDANGKHFAQNTILDWFVQMCYALKYIHGLNIIHRDLKTQNIFLTGDNVLKIGDFGIAKILQDSMDKASTAIGTPYYLSPEICHRHLYGTKSDIWAAGCVLYELCCLVPPFDGPDFSLLVVNIIRGLYSPIPKMYGPLLKDLVDVLLQVQPEKRPSARQVLSVAALQPYVTAHAHRMSRTSYQSPDGRSEPEIDKENVGLSRAYALLVLTIV
ncbi:hypothetical protein CAPTEDRAFT_122573 [Capitella teleta]|uniref:non-specific serine/threonine protein kinase n=1 Tax=Capitella teleta TaxID=283909 RepID=R7UFA4_CAPTE|nr:hypothetical protein CAPTEDRAFT_122573 [Capitella teleta]|eukprot:ELU01932.1 hypothetical protein CAPTEDRAFT_122573 [Capitella teleta]